MGQGKSWADRQGFPTGVLGETYQGVRISEENRATVYESRREGIEQLRDYLHNNYRRKGIKAVIFGIHRPGDRIEYAVFCEDNFIRNATEEKTNRTSRRRAA